METECSIKECKTMVEVYPAIAERHKSYCPAHKWKGSKNGQRVLDYIIAHKTGNDGNSPTLRKIGSACGIAAKTVAYWLDRLERGNKISRGNNGVISVVGGKWSFSSDASVLSITKKMLAPMSQFDTLKFLILTFPENVRSAMSARVYTAITRYHGCVIYTSHSRPFLGRITDRLELTTAYMGLSTIQEAEAKLRYEWERQLLVMTDKGITWEPPAPDEWRQAKYLAEGRPVNEFFVERLIIILSPTSEPSESGITTMQQVAKDTKEPLSELKDALKGDSDD